MANTLISMARLGNKNVVIGQLKCLQKYIDVNQHRTYATDGSKNMGFIGLGNMGNFMSTNLMNKGFSLSVFDVSKDATAAVVGKGAKGFSSHGDVASSGPDAIVTMLPNNKIVLDVYLGKNGLVSKAKKGSLLIDSSTVDPTVAKEISQEAESKGVKFVDAPVSGGVIGAEKATLTFMVGGKKEYFEAAKPFLAPMGANFVHCGDVGSGLIAKICNNMLLAITMIGTSEAMNLGIRLGLDPKVLLGIINNSTGRCWASQINNPVPGLMENVPAANDYKGGFSSALICKDLGLADGVATESQSPIPLGSLSHQIYSTMLAKGLGGKDFGVVYQFLKHDK